MSTQKEHYRRIEKVEGLLFEGEEQVFHMIERIVAPPGLRVDESSPYVDARLPDGARVNTHESARAWQRGSSKIHSSTTTATATPRERRIKPQFRGTAFLTGDLSLCPAILPTSCRTPHGRGNPRFRRYRLLRCIPVGHLPLRHQTRPRTALLSGTPALVKRESPDDRTSVFSGLTACGRKVERSLYPGLTEDCLRFRNVIRGTELLVRRISPGRGAGVSANAVLRTGA
jgi:hypothetical protein